MSWTPHITVATIVEQTGQFLLVEELSEGRLVLNQPAGHLEAGEGLAQAAVRETLEETGWHVELTAVVGIHQWTLPGTDHMYLRICFAGQALRHDSTRALDHGIQRALWLSRDELGQMSGRLRSPLVLACVDGYLSGQRYPLHLIVDHDRKITGHPPA